MLKKFREDFRLAMSILLAGFAVVAIAPFAIIRALSGQWLIAALDTAIALGMLTILRHLLVHGQTHLSRVVSSLFYSLAALGMCYLDPQPMIYWIFPVVIANFFLLQVKVASGINALVLASLLPLQSAFPEHLEFIDLMVSLILVSAFAGIFAWKTDDQHKQLDKWAHLDSLTGIGNRRKFFLELNKRKNVSTCSLAIIDLDHFKTINDQKGHEAGDNILQSVATLFKARLRADTDEIFRYGGEEFLLLLNNTDLAGACLAAEQLRQTLERELGVTASFGCAEYRDQEPWDSWIQRADNELYQAKNAGRNCVRPIMPTQQ